MQNKEKEKSSRVTVSILNEEYVIIGKAQEKHINEVAAYVDYKMRELTLRHPNLSPTKVAVLTAINIADEYLRLQQDHQALIRLLDEESNR